MENKTVFLDIIKELERDIAEIEDIGWQSWKDEEDYERTDELRNRTMINLVILKKVIDKYVNE